MAKRATLRASDADREHVAERLRKATAEGRLLAEELEERLGAAFTARTYGELDGLVSDLPGESLDRRRSGSGVRPWVGPAIGLAIAIPIVVALIAAVLFVVTGIVAAWMFWIVLGWWAIGRRGRVCMRRHAAYRSQMARPHRPRQVQPGDPGYWV
jgi:hypothetical protein